LGAVPLLSLSLPPQMHPPSQPPSPTPQPLIVITNPSSDKREGAEAMALLEALIAALCSDSPAPTSDAPSDARPPAPGPLASGALREVAAGLVGEFLDWSAKHVGSSGSGRGGGGGGDGASRNFNATSLLRRLFDRLVHPRGEVRLGAAHGMVHCAR